MLPSRRDCEIRAACNPFAVIMQRQYTLTDYSLYCYYKYSYSMAALQLSSKTYDDIVPTRNTNEGKSMGHPRQSCSQSRTAKYWKVGKANGSKNEVNANGVVKSRNKYICRLYLTSAFLGKQPIEVCRVGGICTF